MNRRRFLTLSAAFACAPHVAQASTWTGRALGAEVSVTLSGPREATAQALADIPKALGHFETLFSLYRDGSDLTRLNATGQITPAPEMTALLEAAREAHALTNGLFDPTVQPLWQALATGADPAPARKLIGLHRVTSDANSIHLAPGQQLTFNGIAQGFVTDAIKAHLTSAGFTKALINIGEYAALGGPYRLGLSDPTHGHMGHTTLTNQAIATSSPGALRLGSETHILGPAGQTPLWATVSLQGPSATLADALSTAAVFMTANQLAQLKTKARLSRVTVIDAEGKLTTL
ncbi:FAD:protein FMN transferase [Tropicibacter naphthalenivorans]|uniref:FAD:protein FMN transferase n=1 Tax=Tropicibacter naphthalenivorans TaxID=441103 RepID=A0A0P1GN95_9RHOB|nr:FAD:protein FMN transferase [Tropicibacter naphthalenivorans]CUH77352.1 ApbE family protein [Tropicibacter naphthalenivorans]SMC58760.1 thiamine biosynthesis lipoprotein [Tropicibacter naphthalenivorans]